MGVFLLDNLKFYYDCNEGGGTRFDLGPNGLDVAEIGTVEDNPSGALNGAVATTGSTDNYLSAAHNDLFRVGDNPFTLTYWTLVSTGQESTTSPFVAHFNATGVDERAFLARYVGSTMGYVFIVSPDGTSTNDNTVVFGTTPSVDTWHFVACIHDPVANTISIEMDRAGLVSKAHSGGLFNATAPFTIGANFLSGGLAVAVADIDEISGHDRVLNSDELDALFGSGTPPGFGSFVSSSASNPNQDFVTINKLILRR